MDDGLVYLTGNFGEVAMTQPPKFSIKCLLSTLIQKSRLAKSPIEQKFKSAIHLATILDCSSKRNTNNLACVHWIRDSQPPGPPRHTPCLVWALPIHERAPSPPPHVIDVLALPICLALFMALSAVPNSIDLFPNINRGLVDGSISWACWETNCPKCPAPWCPVT